MNPKLHNKVKLLSELAHVYDDFSFDGFTITFNIKKSNFEDVKTNLNNINLKYQESYQTSIIIDIRKQKLGLKTFLDKNDFLKDFKTDTLNEDFSIVLLGDSYLYYSSDEKSFTTKNGTKSSNLLVDNTVSYLLLKESFSSLADYNNTASNEFIFYTSTKGIFKLTYPNISPVFTVNIKKGVNELLNKLESPDFKLFFINELFEYLKGSLEPIKELILSINPIMASAERNHQLYIKNFSFEEFRSKLQTEKSQYFNNIREILGKVLNQLISIPISISAVVFTVYKIESIFPLVIILFGYLVYLIYFIKFQCIYLSDIKELDKDFENDFNEIKIKSGIPIQEIKFEELKVKRRISNIKIIIIALITSTSILSLILVIFILSKMKLFTIYSFLSNICLLVLFLMKLHL